jgi:hypothetical protein
MRHMKDKSNRHYMVKASRINPNIHTELQALMEDRKHQSKTRILVILKVEVTISHPKVVAAHIR